MGEIADALRRAGGARPLDSGSAQAKSGAPALREEAAGRGAEARARVVSSNPVQVIERPAPKDPAIALEDGPALEACRQIALAVRKQLEARNARSMAVVSAVRDEGKTTTSCNLALALASLSPGREVALLDMDLRRPSIAQVLGIATDKGLEDVLTGEASLDEARIEFTHPPLDVYTAMRPQRAAHEILTRSRLGELFSELERRYSMVVVDTPPILLVPDSRLILERIPVCLPVARCGISRVRSFREMLDTLPKGQVLSTLLNGVKPNAQYYHRYDYSPRVADPEPKSKGRRRGRSE